MSEWQLGGEARMWVMGKDRTASDVFTHLNTQKICLFVRFKVVKPVLSNSIF